MRPGLTGYAQVHGRNSITWEERFDYDVYYTNNITFLGDWKIILQTILTVLKRDGISSGNSVTMGKPGHIAGKLASTFASLGTPAFKLHPAEAMHGDLGVVSEKDVVAIEALNVMKAKNISCLVVVENEKAIGTIKLQDIIGVGIVG